MTGAQGPRKDGDVDDPQTEIEFGASALEVFAAREAAGVKPWPLVPHVKGSDTSRAAAESMEPHAGTLEAQVLIAIRASGSGGLTDDELEQLLGLSHQTTSARRRALVIRCLVKDSGARRPTRSGRGATVWIRADGTS